MGGGRGFPGGGSSGWGSSAVLGRRRRPQAAVPDSIHLTPTPPARPPTPTRLPLTYTAPQGLLRPRGDSGAAP
ncbi:hypothetical protein E2C01_076380 [Portunus trituberculatus]|uniref:Uncharacterized protein n=1 Tax=Portunus trituberculatus TaxID=210409 RepID=A0A5B7IJM2_PORTR|nr:hypothetical protein [Portunus trituberculatus]